MAEFIEPPAEWIPGTIIAFFGTSLNILILSFEIMKRRKSDKPFTTKSLKYFSLLSIACGPMVNLCNLLRVVDGFCHFSSFLIFVFWSLQWGLVGFYQLSRLYYCFSKSKAYSKIGYSNYVFIIMIICGILLMFMYPLINLFTGLIRPKSICYITRSGEAHYIAAEYPIFIPAIISWTCWIIYWLWDFITLLLYGLKIRSFKQYKKTQPMVYKRILSILYKIVIITLFYESVTIFNAILGAFAVIFYNPIIFTPISVWAMNVNSVSLSFSMYLMMEHNISQYILFLRLLKKFKLHFFCCCYRHIVIDQLEEINGDLVRMRTISGGTEDKNNERVNKIEVTATFETRDISVNDQKIVTNGRELSIETTVNRQ